MTLKYESEILFDLMKRDGDDAPSGVLPYESELKEKYLKQVEGAYPKLTDYRPEWLNYNLYAHLPADFPVETLSNVTNATVDNVVPYAYGSASLKGQTMVNLLKNKYLHCNLPTGQDIVADGGNTTYDSPEYRIKQVNLTMPLTVGKEYLFAINVKSMENTNFLAVYTYDGTNTAYPAELRATKIGLNVMKYTPTGSIKQIAYYVDAGEGKRVTFGQPMIIEYQEGMENWDISYFEGMQSVQMPRLTTTGKNLFDGELEKGNINVDDGIQSQGDYIISKNFNVINSGVNVICSVEGSIQGRIFYYDVNKNFISTALIEHLEKTPQKAKYFKIRFNKEFLNKDIMMAYGTSIAPYEPYQSNILTSPKDLELRGIGDVKDELNLLTGEVTQNIYEFTLDGSQNIDSDGDLLYYYLPFSVLNNKSICDKFPSITVAQIIDGLTGIATQNRGNASRIYVNINGITTKEDMKKFFLNNPTTIQCALTEKSVKTVELTVTDQNGNSESNIRPFEGTMHIMTNGTPIKPTATIEVPVEAITQNLMSFANIEEEE